MESSSVPPRTFGKEGDKGIEVRGWLIRSIKKPICNTGELERLSKELQAPQLPEMVFGSSLLEITHLKTGLTISYNARDGLQCWIDEKRPAVKVAYAAEWARSKSSSAKSLADSYDWTFSTNYKGTIRVKAAENKEEEQPSKETDNSSKIFGQPIATNERINFDKLRIQETILFFDHVVLYHDELADNGDSLLDVKIRVMPGSFYVLLQFWCRVDDVLFRVHQTRLYHEFNKTYLLREFQVLEEGYDRLKAHGMLPTDPSKLAQPEHMVPLLGTRSLVIEKISLEKV